MVYHPGCAFCFSFKPQKLSTPKQTSETGLAVRWKLWHVFQRRLEPTQDGLSFALGFKYARRYYFEGTLVGVIGLADAGNPVP